MKTLILHNNNLPIDILSIRRDKEHYLLKPIKFESAVLKGHSNFDDFISSILDEVFANTDNNFGLIVMPLSFDNMSQMMYTGLKVALHIRLTEKWKHTKRPILFFGSDSKEEIATVSEYGEILFTPYVDLIDKDLFIEINKYESKSSEMSDAQYKNFLNKIHISAPTYYNTHHSVANEWAYIRWCEMLNIEPKKMRIENMLFYKLLKAKNGSNRFNNKWRKNHPNLISIPAIKDKTIMLIDDEYDKGWGHLLSMIFENEDNSAKLLCCPIDKKLTKDKLIIEISNYIEKNPADIYIVDLRLHEDDFNQQERGLSGHKVASIIKDYNIGNQIIFFTASNKIWNLQKTQEVWSRIESKDSVALKQHVFDYIIKETPEQNLSRNETYLLYSRFQNALSKAARELFIRDYVNSVNTKVNTENIDNFLEIEDFIKLLLLDSSEKKEILVNTLSLKLIVFIEKYIDDRYKLMETVIIKNDNSWSKRNINSSFIFTREKVDNDHFRITGVRLNDNKPLEGDEIIAKTLDKESKEFLLTKIIIVMYYYNNLSLSLINKYVKMKMERNSNIAHNGGIADITLDDVKCLFEEIIMPIIIKEHPQKQIIE